MAILSAASGASAPFHPEFQRSPAPTWSPDGASLIFWADEDLYVAPREAGTAQSAGIGPRFAKAGIGPGPFPDAVWTRYGLIFSARAGFTRDLYLCPLDRHGKSNGDIVRLTNGTELLGDPSVSREGRIVFASGRQRFDIWGVPLDAASGKAKGQPYRITDTLAPTANPDISADGRRLLFGSSRSGFTEIWEKDLDTGKEWVAATSPEGASYGRFLRSGGLLYVRPVAGHDEVYLGNRRVAVGTRAWDADRQAGTILVSGAGIDALDAATGQRVPLLQAPAQTTLSEASFSPDDGWVLFVAKTLRTSRIYIAPARGGDWLPITDSVTNAGKPRFSPDGGLIYFTIDGFTTDGEGTREIAAVHFDSQGGRVLGEAFPVFQPATARLSLHSVNPEALSIAVARDKLVTILCEQTSTIWIGGLVLQ
jgi:Tol biopolymer transport system component